MAEPWIVIVDGARTPIGRCAAGLKSVPAHELGAIAAREPLARSGVDANEIDEVIVGCMGGFGTISMCIGGGQALAALITRFQA